MRRCTFVVQHRVETAVWAGHGPARGFLSSHSRSCRLNCGHPSKGEHIAHVPAELLAQSVHEHWLRDRKARGWTFGRYNSVLRTSPFIKPIALFTATERVREMCLAIGDVLGLSASVGAYNGDLLIDAEVLAKELPKLIECGDNPLISCAATAIHESWRCINSALGLCTSDERLARSFSQLDVAHQELTLWNLQADIAAVCAPLSGPSRSRVWKIQVPTGLSPPGLLEDLHRIADKARPGARRDQLERACPDNSDLTMNVWSH